MVSTALRSALRSLTRLGIVVETISKFARELARFDPALHARIDGELIRRYVDREGAGCFSNTAPSTSRRRRDEAGRDLLCLVDQFKATAAAGLPAFALLEQVLDEQFEIAQGKDDNTPCAVAIPRKPGDMPGYGRLQPCRSGCQLQCPRGLGYTAQIVETYAKDDGPDTGTDPRPTDLITHVAVHKMTVHDHCPAIRA